MTALTMEMVRKAMDRMFDQQEPSSRPQPVLISVSQADFFRFHGIDIDSLIASGQYAIIKPIPLSNKGA